MNPQSFIQSGLLEAYLLGLANPQERDEVERMAAAHPEVRDELAAIERALEGYAHARGEAPPAWMKGRILEKLDEPATATTIHTPTAMPAQRGLGLTRFVALMFGLATLAFGFLYWQELTARRTLEQNQATLQQQVADCQRRGQDTETRRLQVSRQVDFLRDPNTRLLVMSSKEHPQRVHAYHNPNRNTIALDLKTFPPPPAGRYYQIWAIVDGKPVSMDMVDRDADWQELQPVPNATVYAISVEDKPDGNPAPTQVFVHT